MHSFHPAGSTSCTSGSTSCTHTYSAYSFSDKKAPVVVRRFLWKKFVMFAAVAAVLASAPAKADWVGEWFDQSTTTSAGGYQNQERGFYSAGGFQGRYRMNNDYLVTASPPRLNVGCGGVDLFLGGFSYLDPEYLVSKFQRIIQAAPAFAFDMAMSQYCQQCKDTMNTLTSITDMLNGIQMNDCQMARGLAQTTVEQLAAVATSTFGVGEGLQKNSQHFQTQVRAADGASPNPTQDMLEFCPDLFKRIFVNGSVLENASAEVGMTPFAGVMRGMVGDARVTYNPSRNLYAVETFAYCPGNTRTDPDSFVAGTVDAMNSTGTCSASGMAPVLTEVRTRLDGIANKLSTPGGAQALTPEEKAFIDASAFPLFTLLSNATAMGNADALVDILSEPLAYQISHRMLNDLLQVLRFVIVKAGQVATNQQQPIAGAKYCSTDFLLPALDHIKAMEPRISELSTQARVSWQARMSEMNTTLQVTRALADDYRQQMNRISLGQQ
jgi:conjugative transfer pilus assembly protein TraH